MKAKYDAIGTGYNQTRKADKYLTERLLFHLTPHENGLYLDVGCGTGNYTNALQQKGYTFIGIDPSQKMLNVAKAKNHEVRWKIGTAEKTTLPDNYVDGITATLTIHHWENLNRGFAELNRIAKEKSKLVIFTSTPEQMKGYWLNHYFPKMLHASILQMPTYERVEAALTTNGFVITELEPYSIKPDLDDKFLYCGKHQPECYFDEHIRHGISSFSSLANQEEVKKGLATLRIAIDSGKINEIIKSYKNELGDYLYIIARKANGHSISR